MSQKLPQITPRELIRALTRQRAGFFVCHRGSGGGHVHLCHPNDPTILIDIPMHNKPIRKGTLMSIIKQSRLSREEFLKLL